MFDVSSTGSKVRLIATIYFILSEIGLFIGGIFFCINYFDSDFGMYFLMLIIGSIISYVTYVFLSAFGELVENSSIIAYYAQTNSNTSEEFYREKSDDYWECSKCGKFNHKTVGTCGCGTKKSDN